MILDTWTLDTSPQKMCYTTQIKKSQTKLTLGLKKKVISLHLYNGCSNQLQHDKDSKMKRFVWKKVKEKFRNTHTKEVYWKVLAPHQQ